MDEAKDVSRAESLGHQAARLSDREMEIFSKAFTASKQAENQKVRTQAACESDGGLLRGRSEQTTPHARYEPAYGIGWAIEQMSLGHHVTRRGWNGRGQYLQLQQPDDRSKMTLPYIYIRTVQGQYVPWMASQTDLLAQDWQLALY